MRFPDNLNLDTRVLTEVKDVASQGFTKQLRDYVAFSQSKELTFDLYVRPSTHLTSKLEAAIRRGDIHLHYIPGAR
jgi:Restriction endonuclease fold toxin 7